MLKAKQVFDDSDQRFGVDKIRVVLVERSIRVGKSGSQPSCKSWDYTVFR